MKPEVVPYFIPHRSSISLTLNITQKMFTVEQIALAHSKIQSGAEFPIFIQEIRELGVTAFETSVRDGRTKYFGISSFQVQSNPVYKPLTISNSSDKDTFIQYLKIHQKGETDYLTFCKHCAQTGIEKWIVDLDKMTCTYYDKSENEILVENIPSV